MPSKLARTDRHGCSYRPPRVFVPTATTQPMMTSSALMMVIGIVVMTSVVVEDDYSEGEHY